MNRNTLERTNDYPELKAAKNCELLELALMSNAKMRELIECELDRRARKTVNVVIEHSPTARFAKAG